MRLLWDLRTKFVVMMAVMMLVTNFITAFLFQNELHTVLVNTAHTETAAETKALALVFERSTQRLAEDVTFLAQTPPVAGIARAAAAGGTDPLDGSSLVSWSGRLESLFVGMLHSRKGYEQARFVGVANGGRELVRVDRYGEAGGVRIVPTDELQLKGDSPYMRELQSSSERGVRFSEIELNREQGDIVEPHRPVIRASIPVFDASGALFGLVIINGSMGSTFEELYALTTPGRDLYLTNGAGQALVHPNPDESFKFEFGVAPDLRGDFPALASAMQRQSRAPSADIESLSAAHVVWYGSAPNIRRTGLVLRETEGALHGTTADTMRGASLYIIAMLLLALLGAMHVAHRIYTPIVSVAKTMAAIEVGQPFQPIEVPASYEAGLVSTAFNDTYARLGRTLQQLRARNEEVEQLTYLASHDLQEPARTVHSYTTLLARRYGDQFDAIGTRSIEYLTEASTRMLGLIRSILDHTNLGRLSEFGEVNMDALIDEVCTDLAPAIEEAGATVESQPLPLVNGLQIELRVLLQNLVANAIKFQRPTASPCIKITGESTPLGVVFSVTDNGVGVPAEKRESLFHLLRRGHDRAQYRGFGIGLAHCKKIVELHEGRIWIEDAPGGGSVFSFELPHEKHV